MSNEPETKELISDSAYSKVHNEAVIDPLIAQMRDAGYTGSVTDMVREACELKIAVDTPAPAPRPSY